LENEFVKANPILEEVWRIKDQLAAEADYDIDRFFENLRKWEAEHPHTGPVVRNAEELRQLVADKERERAAESAMALNQRARSDEDVG
jgi:hypothetical protein